MKTFISLISLIKFPRNLNCIKSFRTKTDTNKHEQIHIGERPAYGIKRPINQYELRYDLLQFDYFIKSRLITSWLA